MDTLETSPVVLTGDRPTGPLHLGHYAGSLEQRLQLQNKYRQYVLIADVQAMTDYFNQPEFLARQVREIMLDYLSVGLDPAKTTFVLQSQIPEISELFVYFLNLITLARLQRNPTVKDEMKQKKIGADIPAGFLTYPVHQAADITVFGAALVPVGEDQLPMIEQTREIVRTFNRTYGDTLVEPRALLSRVPRLPGIEGRSKMSKSLGNTIPLHSDPGFVERQVMRMYTDPLKIHASDPGHVEGNVVFSYLDAFDPDQEGLAGLKERYISGKTGDVAVKKRLIAVLNDFLFPLRAKRKEWERHIPSVLEILRDGTVKAGQQARDTMGRVRGALKMEQFL